MNPAHECITCKQCARLLMRYEALKRERTRIESGLGECASTVGEIDTQVAESHMAYTQHWATHRGAQISSGTV